MFVTEAIWQCSLLAQGDGAGEWMNILFIVVVAVFWAIGGIVKAAGAGRKDRQRQKGPSFEQEAPKRENLLQQLARKAQEMQRALEDQGKQRPQNARQQGQQAKRPKPPAGRVAVRTGRGGEPVLVYERQASSPTGRSQEQQASEIRAGAQREQKAKARLTPPPAEIPTAPALAQEAPQTRPAGREEATPVAGATSLLVDYSAADALKRAILDYEILGRPLAFRHPFERTSPF